MQKHSHIEMCVCGKPLHYSDPKNYQMVNALCERLGSNIKISVPALGAWMVPRHYIALHGLAAQDLPILAVQYGFERVSQ